MCCSGGMSVSGNGSVLAMVNGEVGNEAGIDNVKHFSCLVSCFSAARRSV